MTYDTVECSECGIYLAKSEGPTTAGYYDVSSGQWAEYAKPGQTILCDKCMWATPGYISAYGKVSSGTDETQEDYAI